MNTKEFVEAIIEIVRDASISDTIENLKEPSGRKPDKEDVELSQWYSNLSKEDMENIARVISKAVDGSIFGLLTVFDSVRVIEDNSEGEFELVYKNATGRTLLNDPKCEYLHDVFNSLIK